MNSLNYMSALATAIQEAVNDCIEYGCGQSSLDEIRIGAEWAENETDIEVTVGKGYGSTFTFTEKNVMEGC